MSYRKLLEAQGGVVARFQLVRMGLAPYDIRRLLRRNELALLWPGVYVAHTGRPTLDERRAGAVLCCWPAALGGRSALGVQETASVEVVVGLRRTVRPPAGLVVRRTAGFERIRARPFPPRQRAEDAALDVASELRDPVEAYSFLAEVLQARLTTASRLERVANERARLSNRRVINGVLADLGDGRESLLEAQWARVAKRHGLPAGQQQVAGEIGGRRVWRDELHREFGVVIELDGRAFHDNASARSRDHARDLHALSAEGLITVRLTYGQVFGKPCHTACEVAEVLRSRGWSGRVHPCKIEGCCQ